jgi:CRP-like cAMP-binding protein
LIWLKYLAGCGASIPSGEERAKTAKMTETNGRLIEGVVANLPMFKQATRAHLADVTRSARAVHAPRGAVICRRNDPMPGLYAVAFGLVKLALGEEPGEEKVLRLVGPGETFGEAVAFLERPCPVNAIALTDTLLVMIPSGPMFALIERDARFARSLIASLSLRMQALVADVEAAALRTGLQRVAAYLESLTEPGPALGRANVRLPATKTVIAARLGVTKETFSRLLRELTDQGLVQVTRREITLLDRARLAAVARGTARDAGHALTSGRTAD